MFGFARRARVAHEFRAPSVRARLDDGTVRLHGWVYDMGSLTLSVFDPDREAFVASPAPQPAG